MPARLTFNPLCEQAREYSTSRDLRTGVMRYYACYHVKNVITAVGRV